LLAGLCMGPTALMTALNLPIVQLWEYEVQTFFFELRGPVPAPDDIVILAIDEESLSQGQHYIAEPERYPELAGISTWPWHREVYAGVIDRLIESGAKAVALDVVFATPGANGADDDAALQKALETYGDQVVIAAQYDEIQMNQGPLIQPLLPLPQYLDTPVHVGNINFLKEPNGEIHRLGSEFLKTIAKNDIEMAGEPLGFDRGALVSFAEATLEASKTDYKSSAGEHLFFYGPKRSFEHIPFWSVVDSDPWRSQLSSGAVFKDKIVLIGSTAPVHQDFHAAPFSGYPYALPGVEILANNVATLREGKALRMLVRSPWLNAAIVLGLSVGVAAMVYSWPRQKPLRRLTVGVGCGLLWGLISFAAFTGGQLILLTAMPVISIVSLTLVDFISVFLADQLKKKTLRNTLARYVTSPIVQEIISQQDDLQDLLTIRESELTGTVLSDRYRILKVLGAGGFGETYLAEDTQRPGNPTCVVKQLKIVSDNPKAHRLAQRLFASEAATLEKLGEHDQIPRLLAYFEYNYSFYLVQEMVDGKLLRDSLANHQPMSQREVVEMLLNLLPVIQAVHERGVIHRDIKPSNLIRRYADGQYVLIDFGAVKQISNKLTDTSARITSTVGIGTQGYMPSEQSAGLPNFSSDLYALGITAIEALTGLPPHALQRSHNGEILWTHKVKDLVPELATVLERMVRYDFNQRYQSTRLALEDLYKIELSKLPTTSSDEYIRVKSAHQNGSVLEQPGVVDIDSKLDSTEILPTGWAENFQPSPKAQPDVDYPPDAPTQGNTGESS
ncbi:MAG: serine/threonine-protein kinase, partial [Cyanobacteria bacterium P01_F01_bin.4]